MKKLLAIGMLFISITIFSQKVQPGVRIGTNISKIYGIKGNVRTNFYVGGTLSLNLGRFYTLQPEVGYSSQGGSNVYKRKKVYNDDDTYQYEESYRDVNLQYLSLGLASKFYITPYRNLALILAPSFDIIVGDNYEKAIIGNNGYIYQDTNNNEITDADLALSLGLEYELPFGLGIEARYKHGLVNVLTEGIPFFSDKDSKNRLLQLGLTYKFK